MFDRLFHADWSVDPRKRWSTTASRIGGGWEVATPVQIVDTLSYRHQLVELRHRSSVLAGFDFPIGIPLAYAKKTGLVGFKQAVLQFGVGRYESFFTVAANASDITHERPFYPFRPGGTKQAHLLAAHQALSITELRRRCEQATAHRSAACSLFWTLGGNQVGKAAIDGWQAIVRPSLAAGARLWPFDGPLETLAEDTGLVIAETYPGEAYGHVGLRFRRESKRSQEHRRAKSQAIFEWAKRSDVTLAPDLHGMIADGFGSDSSGEDRFDSAVGLFGMITVASGTRDSGEPEDDQIRRWEGWILGLRA